MLRIVVDDERKFKGEPDIIYLRNSNDAMALLSRIWTQFYLNYSDEVAEIWLDHDLGPDDDIRIVAQFLYAVANKGAPFPVLRIYVHTQNAVGGEWVMQLLKNIGYVVERVSLPRLENVNA